MPERPRGTVTFLFTDVEGSTQLLRQLGERYGVGVGRAGIEPATLGLKVRLKCLRRIASMRKTLKQCGSGAAAITPQRIYKLRARTKRG